MLTEYVLADTWLTLRGQLEWSEQKEEARIYILNEGNFFLFRTKPGDRRQSVSWLVCLCTQMRDEGGKRELTAGLSCIHRTLIKQTFLKVFIKSFQKELVHEIVNDFYISQIDIYNFRRHQMRRRKKKRQTDDSLRKGVLLILVEGADLILWWCWWSINCFVVIFFPEFVDHINVVLSIVITWWYAVRFCT